MAYSDPSHYQQLIRKARALDGLVEAPTALEFLDDIVMPQQRQWAHDVLRDTEPHVVAVEYGPEALIWTAMQEAQESVFERQAGILKKHGYDDDLVRRACIWTRQYAYSMPSGSAALSHYGFMESVTRADPFANIELGRLILEAADKPLPQNVLSRYDLQIVRSEPSFDYVDGLIECDLSSESFVWVDTPVGFTLNYKNEPNAVVAFMPETQDELMIHQLQGSKPKRRNPKTGEVKTYPSRGIMSFDWRKVMVQASAQLALQNGFANLGIQQGSRNIWCYTRFEEEQPHLTFEQAAQAYDKQADRLGFTRGQDGNWHKGADQIS